jgi:hypothetical protein
MTREHVTEDLDKFYASWVSEEHLSPIVIYRHLSHHTAITFGWLVGSFL